MMGWRVARVGPARQEFAAIVAYSFQEFLDHVLGSDGRVDLAELTC